MIPPARDSTIQPRRIGPYSIEARLGKGGMGEVYRAFDERLRRRVAIKQVLAKEAEKANVRQRFRREARTVARLNHSAIVRIYDILESDDGDWIVMELVEGRTIRELMRRSELPLEKTLRLAREIAGGLAAAHEKGIVHRDLKVENVMVTDKGHAKILDFGLAKRLGNPDPSDSTLSGSGVVAGTFRAMSPEQIMEEGVDARSDLFSFGTLLYEMATGESPFKAPSVVATMTRVCRHRQAPARSLNEEIPPELSELIDHLLEKEPARRPQSALEVVRRLDQLTGETTVLPQLEGLAPPELAEPDPAASDSYTPTLPMETACLPGRAERFPPAGTPVADGPIAIKTLVATEVAERSDLFDRLGEEKAAKALRRLDELRGELLNEYAGQVQGRADDTLLMFERPAAALGFALALHRRTAGLSRELRTTVRLRTGIHLGEVALDAGELDESTRYSGYDLAAIEAESDAAACEGLPEDVSAESHTVLVARSLVCLARPNQILFTHAVDELVRRGSVGRRFAEQELTWQDHGLRRLPGVGEEVEVFEVGFADEIPIAAPGAAGGAESPTVPGPRDRRASSGALVAVTVALLVVAAFFLVVQGCPT